MFIVLYLKKSVGKLVAFFIYAIGRTSRDSLLYLRNLIEILLLSIIVISVSQNYFIFNKVTFCKILYS